MSTNGIKDVVRERYAAAALRATAGGSACCGGASAVAGAPDPITSNLYGAHETLGLLAAAVQRPRPRQPDGPRRAARGHTVLDLGSGGGIDVLPLAARRRDRQGLRPRHDGRDARTARENQRVAQVANVEFLKASSSTPLLDATVDVIISNCVVNPSADKDRALAERSAS